MIFRSKAPLRLGLAGGGTDVSPFSDLYGGEVLNATINLFAYTSIEPLNDNKIIIDSIDLGKTIEYESAPTLPIDGNLDLVKGVYNRIIKDFNLDKVSFNITTKVDAPPGSGLGTSSTLVVSIIGAFVEWLRLPLGDYDIAHLAYSIEREDLKLTGGKQDQYAAAFGGFNFIEFYNDNRVIVNPLRIKDKYIDELENCIVLYYTGTSRLSSKIIDAQTKNVLEKQEKPIEAMHRLKEQAIMMKVALLKGELSKIGNILNYGWNYKKQMANEISNPVIDEIYSTALEFGASGGKMSGAGGGGFMMFYCPLNTRYNVIKKLTSFGGEFRRFQFTGYGVKNWISK